MKPIEITNILKGSTAEVQDPNCEVEQLLTDSRHSGDLSHFIFFAIPTNRNTGCRYVYDLYQRGVRNFVVPSSDVPDTCLSQFAQCEKANFWYVKDVVLSLQQLAAYRRTLFDIPVVGITGSNGKTIIKDWIVQMLGDDRKIVASPRSYNSQIGVPLSVWQLGHNTQIGVFEAGISEVGEMDKLRRVINPTIGIFSNIGSAHDENFLTRSQKIAEKLNLFLHCQTLIYCSDYKEIQSAILQQEAFRNIQRFTWGSSDDDTVRLVGTQVERNHTVLTVRYQEVDTQITIPFIDRASAENAMHCITLLFYLGYTGQWIAQRCSQLAPVAMRLEMKEALNNSLLVNDSYSLDLNSLTIALDFVMHERQHQGKTLIMSDILQAGVAECDLYQQVATLISQHGITRFIGIGEALCRNNALFANIFATFYPTTEDFIRQLDSDSFANQTILLKGARLFHFEDIACLLQRKSHQTIMEVNLDNLISNLNHYRSLISPTTKLMAMVKAASYGAGKEEVASALQYNHVDYLTVAYSDEGVDLRRKGITLPIMVMNPEEESFPDIIRYQLEPDIYSFRIFEAYSDAVRLSGISGKMPVHIELDTGMHRLGFSANDLDELIRRFKAPDCVLRVQSIFSHFACADDPSQDEYTHLQISRFDQWSTQLKQALADEGILRHILNSSGIARFPQAQFDMVRLGIGLYGIAPEPEVQKYLKPVSALKTRISQLKDIPRGDTVGYNRRWVAQRDSRIAIISIGYADGLNRHLGYENGRVLVNGHQVPIIGSICMDMCFLDVTDVTCIEGDEVVIFGDADLLKQISAAAGTIPYEILTSVSPRVKRVYYQE
ncbi:MAG: bifunctional UDP-N-acetylmuramoyl-tripeptide:D-alanyl-D-alanine ligase/alanine racemase [Bacteroidales bacterium]|nr:bifunctional UDP-N-acetylmuramoyl-tripeptide:D-alanyl-D-alanine ligase/alanine racemase [Bacteroidales bacterium]